MKKLIGMMMVVALGLTARTWGAENTPEYSPSDAERARWTMQDMRSIAITLAAYKVDHKTYPTVSSPEELRKLVEPTYIRALPMSDAWGKTFRVSADGTKGYRIVSSGADGRFDESSWVDGGEQASFGADAVLTTDMKFVRSWAYR